MVQARPRLYLDDLRSARWNERIDRMFERMHEENRRWQEQWLEEHGTTSAIALLDLERMFEERDRENPRWRAQWRKQYRRDPERHVLGVPQGELCRAGGDRRRRG